MGPPGRSAVLPAKEANLFKSVVKLYETKQLKKALKAADAILKRFPDHGETLAMKGLTLNALDRKVEATDLVRRGLRMDMRSHICWHVYGLLYRSERDYREAAKAYLNALRIDKDNQQILRDLALLQIQIRDYDGLEDTRRTLLGVKPSQRNNWIGFALAFHLLRNYTMAASVLDTYRDTLKSSTDPEDRYEASELLLYKNFILEESGDHAAALNHLDHCGPKLVDFLAVRETRARLLVALGRFDDAADQLIALLRINPDNRVYQKGLQSCRVRAAKEDEPKEPNGSPPDSHTVVEAVRPVVDPELDYGLKKLAAMELRTIGPVPPIRSDRDVAIALEVCNNLTKEFPKSRTAQRMALEVIPSGEHPEFMPRVDAYVRGFLRKGVPSLFSDVKPLYEDETKAEVFGHLFENYCDCLEDEGRGTLPEIVPLPESAGDVRLRFGRDADAEDEPPSTLLWVLHFLAQHYDRVRQFDRALEMIDRAIEHTPTAIECYLVRAKILKHCGDLKGAVEVANDGRNLDLADRYLNTTCAKYALRADMLSEAESWVGLFTRDADSGGVQALYDMQCMWFEIGAAESHLRNGQLAQALKKFTAVERHFADMVEDQFDFHSYCIRKVTLRAYISLLRFEDHIRGHPYYARAAGGIVQCLLRLFDLPERERQLLSGEHSDIAGFANMTESERKKAVSKRKKQLARQRQAQQGASGGKGSGKQSVGSVKQGSGSGKPTANGVEKSSGAGSETSGKASGTNNENKPKANSGWMEIDPTGENHVRELFKKGQKSDPILEEATKYVRELQRHLGYQLQTLVLSFELAMRKRKYLQALRAVKRAQRIFPDDSNTLLISVKLAHELTKNGVRESFSNTVKSVYDTEGDILGGRTEIEYTDNYLLKNKAYAERRVGAERCKLWLVKSGVSHTGNVESVCKSISDCIEDCNSTGTGINFLTAAFLRQLLIDLKQEGIEGELLSAITKSCRSQYPMASCF